MSHMDIFYLALVIVAFTGFAGTLAYYSREDSAYRALKGEDSRDQAKAGKARSMAKAA